MKYICTYACQFRGVLVRPDTVLDISDAEAKANAGVIGSSFAPFDAEKKVADDGENERDKYGMTKQDYRDKLQSLGAVYGPTDTIDQLRKTFERLTSDAPKKRAKPQ